MSESYEPLIGNRYNGKKRGSPDGMPLSCFWKATRTAEAGYAGTERRCIKTEGKCESMPFKVIYRFAQNVVCHVNERFYY